MPAPLAPFARLDASVTGEELALSPAVAPPARLQIPALGIDAAVEGVGLTGEGAMASPTGIWNVGWFAAGPAPGSPGDAVLDGHRGLPGSPLVFGSLSRLAPGDRVVVIAVDGTARSFAVTRSASWPAAAHPPGLFATEGPPRLSLITCTGQYLPASASYTDRVIVEADAVSQGSG